MSAPPVAAAIYGLLAADAALVAMLGGAATIFPFSRIPPGTAFPYVVIGGPIGPRTERTLDRRGGGRILTESRGVSVWFEAAGDVGPVDEAGYRISALLDYCTLDLTPHRFVRCRASAPAEQPGDTLAFGRRVNLLVRYQEA